MMIETSYSLYGLLFANAALLAAAALAVLRFQRIVRESRTFWESPTGAAMKTEEPARIDQSKLLAHQISVLQETVSKLCQWQQSSAAVPPSQMPLEHAARMARRGASVEDLTQNCGLNIGEARLMHTLHGQRPLSIAASST
ncbi:MAG: DUF2802 domain-containing protein [Gammaproteobacteria bacterium]|nr:DUF2802 domain-containing protein [Gammaproteobacteria bacterium]